MSRDAQNMALAAWTLHNQLTGHVDECRHCRIAVRTTQDLGRMCKRGRKMMMKFTLVRKSLQEEARASQEAAPQEAIEGQDS